MKTTALTVMMTVMVVIGYARPHSHVEVIQSEDTNLFLLTSAKCEKGSQVEIFYSNGDLVMSPMRIVRRKMVIDFKAVKNGTYTIVVKKGETTQEFQFEKR